MDNKSSSQLRKEFLESYQRLLVPFLKNYEQVRKMSLIKIYVIIGIVAILAIVALVALKSLPAALLVFIAVVFALIGVGVFFNGVKRYKKRLKENLMPLICQCCKNLTYQDDYKNKNDFVSARIFGKPYTSVKFSSVFSGKRGDTNFELYEANFVNSTNKKETVFSGVIIRLKLYKKIDTHTVVYKNSVMNSPFTFDLKKISIDNINFEEKTSIYTNDTYVAKHIINTELMNCLKGISKSFAARIYSCAFCKDDFFLALETNQHLFPVNDIKKSLIDDNGFFILFDSFITVYRLIDYFKENVKLDNWVVIPTDD